MAPSSFVVNPMLSQITQKNSTRLSEVISIRNDMFKLCSKFFRCCNWSKQAKVIAHYLTTSVNIGQQIAHNIDPFAKIEILLWNIKL